MAAGANATGSCSDNAGNSDSATFGPVKVDTLPNDALPISKKADNSAYSAGDWTNQNVTVSYSCSDGGSVSSGVASTSAADAFTAETAGANATGSCSDNAGNSDSATFGPVKIDKTKPTITASAKKADNSAYSAGDWTNQNVTVSYSCSDGGSVSSGVASTSAADAFTAETAGANATGSCSDNAGNSDSATVGPVKIDK